MEDKELYDFFKNRSHTFNEVPGNALWAKIEAQMTPTDAKPLNGKTRLFKKGLLLFIIAALISGVVFLMLPQKEVLQRETNITKEITTQPAEQIVQEQDTVKKKAGQKQAIKFAPKKEKKKEVVGNVAPQPSRRGHYQSASFCKN